MVKIDKESEKGWRGKYREGVFHTKPSTVGTAPVPSPPGRPDCREERGQPPSPLLMAGLTAAQYGKNLMPPGTPVHLNARLSLSGAQVVQKNCWGLIVEAGACAPPGSVAHTASSEVALTKWRGGVRMLL